MPTMDLGTVLFNFVLRSAEFEQQAAKIQSDVKRMNDTIQRGVDTARSNVERAVSSIDKIGESIRKQNIKIDEGLKKTQEALKNIDLLYKSSAESARKYESDTKRSLDSLRSDYKKHNDDILTLKNNRIKTYNENARLLQQETTDYRNFVANRQNQIKVLAEMEVKYRKQAMSAKDPDDQRRFSALGDKSLSQINIYNEDLVKRELAYKEFVKKMGVNARQANLDYNSSIKELEEQSKLQYAKLNALETEYIDKKGINSERLQRIRQKRAEIERASALADQERIIDLMVLENKYTEAEAKAVKERIRLRTLESESTERMAINEHASMENLRRQLEYHIFRIQRIGETLSRFAQQTFFYLTMVTGGIAAFIKTGVEMNSVIQRATMGFNDLTGSSALSAKFIQALREEALKSILTFKELLPLAQRLSGAYGVHNLGRVLPTIRAVGDLASDYNITPAGQENAFQAINSLINTNTPNKRYIDQLQKAVKGFSVYGVLKDSFGTTDTKELIKQGVTGRAVMDAFVRAVESSRYAGAQLRQSLTTIPGLISNIGDAWNEFSARITELTEGRIIKVLRGVFDSLQEIINNKTAMKEYISIFDALGTTIATVVGVFKNLITYFANLAPPTQKFIATLTGLLLTTTLITAAVAFLAGGFLQLKTLVMQSIVAFAKWKTAALEGEAATIAFKDTVAGTIGTLGLIALAITGVVSFFNQTSQFKTTNWNAELDKFNDKLNKVGDTSKDVSKKIEENFDHGFNQFVDYIPSMLNKIPQIIYFEVTAGFKKVIIDLKTYFSEFGDFIKMVMKDAFDPKHIVDNLKDFLSRTVTREAEKRVITSGIKKETRGIVGKIWNSPTIPSDPGTLPAAGASNSTDEQDKLNPRVKEVMRINPSLSVDDAAYLVQRADALSADTGWRLGLKNAKGENARGNWLLSIWAAESNINPKATSLLSGTYGLGQIHPSAYGKYGIKDPNSLMEQTRASAIRMSNTITDYPRYNEDAWATMYHQGEDWYGLHGLDKNYLKRVKDQFGRFNTVSPFEQNNDFGTSGTTPKDRSANAAESIRHMKEELRIQTIQNKVLRDIAKAIEDYTHAAYEVKKNAVTANMTAKEFNLAIAQLARTRDEAIKNAKDRPGVKRGIEDKDFANRREMIAGFPNGRAKFTELLHLELSESATTENRSKEDIRLNNAPADWSRLMGQAEQTSFLARQAAYEKFNNSMSALTKKGQKELLQYEISNLESLKMYYESLDKSADVILKLQDIGDEIAAKEGSLARSNLDPTLSPLARKTALQDIKNTFGNKVGTNEENTKTALREYKNNVNEGIANYSDYFLKEMKNSLEQFKYDSRYEDTSKIEYLTNYMNHMKELLKTTEKLYPSTAALDFIQDLTKNISLTADQIKETGLRNNYQEIIKTAEDIRKNSHKLDMDKSLAIDEEIKSLQNDLANKKILVDDYAKANDLIYSLKDESAAEHAAYLQRQDDYVKQRALDNAVSDISAENAVFNRFGFKSPRGKRDLQARQQAASLLDTLAKQQAKDADFGVSIDLDFEKRIKAQVAKLLRPRSIWDDMKEDARKKFGDIVNSFSEAVGQMVAKGGSLKNWWKNLWGELVSWFTTFVVRKSIEGIESIFNHKKKNESTRDIIGGVDSLLGGKGKGPLTLDDYYSTGKGGGNSAMDMLGMAASFIPGLGMFGKILGGSGLFGSIGKGLKKLFHFDDPLNDANAAKSGQDFTNIFLSNVSRTMAVRSADLMFAGGFGKFVANAPNSLYNMQRYGGTVNNYFPNGLHGPMTVNASDPKDMKQFYDKTEKVLTKVTQMRQRTGEDAT